MFAKGSIINTVIEQIANRQNQYHYFVASQT